MGTIRIAIAGLGNCASSLIQGISYYSSGNPEDAVGLMHWDIGGFRPGDIQVVAAFESQCGGNAAPGVPGHEQVVGALGRVGVTHEAALAPNGAELRVAASHHLVWVDLVPGVPDKSVPTEVEGRMKRYSQFDHAQVGGEMRAASAEQTVHGLAHLVSQLYKLVVAEPQQIVRRSNGG